MFSWSLILIGPFSCSSAFALHETVELSIGNFVLEKELWSSELKMHSLRVVQRSEFWAPWFSTANVVRAVWNSAAQNSTPMVQWSFFFNQTPRSQNHRSYRSKRIPGGQNYGSYCSKRPKPWELSLKTKPQRPPGRSSHGNGSPVAICPSSQKIKTYRVIFSRQNVANFSTKLITFWPIA